MNYGGAITKDISRLLELFRSHCTERQTLGWLYSVASDRTKWHGAKGVFNSIRAKSLKAARTGNQELEAQYLFEEVCAKTLYNLGAGAAPFDPDTPYWLVPNAISFGRRIGVTETAVLACVSFQGGEPDA